MPRPARARIAACLLLVSLAPGRADPAPVIHYAPIENPTLRESIAPSVKSTWRPMF